MSKSPLTGFQARSAGNQIELLTENRTYKFSKGLIAELLSEKSVRPTKDCLVLTKDGLLRLKQMLNPEGVGRDGNWELKSDTVPMTGKAEKVVVNINESPLRRLFERKTAQGTSYITAEEFQAGERLRQDFERGQLQPRVSAKLEGAIGGSGRNGSAGNGEISDFAIDARARVNRAIDALGPELSGVAIDVCCFLKGMEATERERQWPPRSAKLMLKAALAVLARHYGITGYCNRNAGKIKTWSTPDNRPELLRA